MHVPPQPACKPGLTGCSGEFELDHRLQSALEMRCNELEEGCLLQNAAASGYQETNLVSETELSLAAKSANSAFPSMGIEASFGLKRAAQGAPSPCRHPGKAEAERQKRMRRHCLGTGGGRDAARGWDGRLRGRSSVRGFWRSRQTARSLDSAVGLEKRRSRVGCRD